MSKTYPEPYQESHSSQFTIQEYRNQMMLTILWVRLNRENTPHSTKFLLSAEAPHRAVSPAIYVFFQYHIPYPLPSTDISRVSSIIAQLMSEAGHHYPHEMWLTDVLLSPHIL